MWICLCKRPAECTDQQYCYKQIVKSFMHSLGLYKFLYLKRVIEPFLLITVPSVNVALSTYA